MLQRHIHPIPLVDNKELPEMKARTFDFNSDADVVSDSESRNFQNSEGAS